MSRVQLALNVSNIDEAVSFYSELFQTAPNKIKPGYANFAIADPPLKLVLIENAADAGSLNHLGIEVESVEEVPQGAQRTTCCYAVQDKVWVEGPDNRPWEIYAVVEDADVMSVRAENTCCS